MRVVRPLTGGVQRHLPETEWLQFFCHWQIHLWFDKHIYSILDSFLKASDITTSEIVSSLSVTHPAERRCDGCSLQPASSCSLQETHTKPHQRYECGVDQTDCISLSYLPCKLETGKICKSRERIICNLSHTNSLQHTVTLECKPNMECYTHLSSPHAGEPKFLAYIFLCMSETHEYVVLLLSTSTIPTTSEV